MKSSWLKNQRHHHIRWAVKFYKINLSTRWTLAACKDSFLARFIQIQEERCKFSAKLLLSSQRVQIHQTQQGSYLLTSCGVSIKLT
jgi:hypothetical protein